MGNCKIETELETKGYKPYESILFKEKRKNERYYKSFFKIVENKEGELYRIHFHISYTTTKLIEIFDYEVCVVMKIAGLMNEIYIKNDLLNPKAIEELEVDADALWKATRGL